jgi:hypothetical protein
VREPIASRELTWTTESGSRPILVRIWSPVEHEGNFFCDFAVDGFPEPIRSFGGGVDSLQALVIALQALRVMIEPYIDDVAWFDERGSSGLPYIVTHFLSAEQRRLEQLVEREKERTTTEYLATSRSARRHARLRKRYDPNPTAVDAQTCPIEELIDLLNEASRREVDFRERGNRDAAFVFSQKKFELLQGLRQRPEREAVLRRLAAAREHGQRPLRYAAAMMIRDRMEQALFLERLRDEGVDPEAKEAAKWLEWCRKDRLRPKPWDELTTSAE